jgi:hypothetical protein
MISLQDSIRYIALAAIIYFLVKAFANDTLDNQQIALLVICILLVVAFLMYQTSCPAPKRSVEKYQITDPPVVDSIYPGPPNTNPVLGKPEVPPTRPKYEDPDIRDFKDIMGIDKKTYEALVKNEERAENKIRSRYQDEMVFTSTHPFNTVPLGTQLYGYTYLPPENWFRAYERPPVCVTDKKCNVCPIAEKSAAGLMEFDTSNNVMGPDGINLRYVRKILNKDI